MSSLKEGHNSKEASSSRKEEASAAAGTFPSYFAINCSVFDTIIHPPISEEEEQDILQEETQEDSKHRTFDAGDHPSRTSTVKKGDCTGRQNQPGPRTSGVTSTSEQANDEATSLVSTPVAGVFNSALHHAVHFADAAGCQLDCGAHRFSDIHERLVDISHFGFALSHLILFIPIPERRFPEPPEPKPEEQLMLPVFNDRFCFRPLQGELPPEQLFCPKR